MALAVDNTAQGSATGGASMTFSMTVTNTFPILFVGVAGDGGATQNIGTATFNGQAMTQVAAVNGGNTGGFYPPLKLFYIANVAGTGNVVVTNSGTSLNGFATSYTNAKGTIDNFTTGDSGGFSPLTTTLITVADNCWTILMGETNAGSITAGTGSTLRIASSGNGLFDSNGLIHPAGSKSMTISDSTGLNQEKTTIMASFAPLTTTNYTMSTNGSSFALTGEPITFQKALHMITSVGSFALTGIAATLKAIKTFTLDTKHTSTFNPDYRSDSEL